MNNRIYTQDEIYPPPMRQVYYKRDETGAYNDAKASLDIIKKIFKEIDFCIIGRNGFNMQGIHCLCPEILLNNLLCYVEYLFNDNYSSFGTPYLEAHQEGCLKFGTKQETEEEQKKQDSREKFIIDKFYNFFDENGKLPTDILLKEIERVGKLLGAKYRMNEEILKYFVKKYQNIDI